MIGYPFFSNITNPFIKIVRRMCIAQNILYQLRILTLSLIKEVIYIQHEVFVILINHLDNITKISKIKFYF